MNPQVEDSSLVKTSPLCVQEMPEDKALSETVLSANGPFKIAKADIRTSLKALTTEGALATVFYSIIGGALLSNFLLDLGANTVEIGMLASIPQLTNLLQPLGAYLGDRINSRHWYSLLIFGSSRLPWLIIVPGIWLVSSSRIHPHNLVLLTLAIICLSNFMEALGRASFLSWLAVLVPDQMRGRFFGIRNSIVTSTNFIAVPLLGLAVSKWPGGSLQGFGAVLVLGIVFGVLSLVFQFWMTDVNPQVVNAAAGDTDQGSPWETVFSFLKNANFLMFLLYSGLWSFAVNVSAPFFNLYLLGDLNLDVSVVTLYNSLGAGANLLMQIFWGKLADRIGNRPLMRGNLGGPDTSTLAKSWNRSNFPLGLVPVFAPASWCDVGGDRPVQWQSDDVGNTAAPSVDLLCDRGVGSWFDGSNGNHCWWFCRDCDGFGWLARRVCSLSRFAAVCPRALSLCSRVALCARASANASPDRTQAASSRYSSRRHQLETITINNRRGETS